MPAREGGVSLEPPVGAAHGAAWRRRQRRLRSIGRFTALSVMVALGTSLHHSAGLVPLVPDVAQEVVQRVNVVERRFDGLEQTVDQHCLRRVSRM